MWEARGTLARALWPLSLLYGAITALRRQLYRRGLLSVCTLPIPVVVVGNLVAGGAGKTPTVMAVVALLRRHGFRPGIISRGYGRRGNAQLEVEPHTAASLCGDEPLLLRLRTGVPVVVGRDRAAAGRMLLRAHPGIDVIVSDDGLQHLGLARSAQVLVFDERGAGNGWLLPAGPLREPMPPRLPARSVVLYNAGVATTALPGGVARRSLGGAVALADWWQGRPASMATLEALRGHRVVAAAGLGRPGRFFAMLRSHGLDIVALPLADHFAFAVIPWPAASGDVVVTEKDAVKLTPERAGAARVWVVTLDFETDPAFDAALLRLLTDLPETVDRHGSPIA